MAASNDGEYLSGHPNAAFEAAVRAAIVAGGYGEPGEQRPMASLSDGRKYLLDMVIGEHGDHPVCIQLFYQAEGGSAQERVPYLALRLINTVRELRRAGASLAGGYLVLDGAGIADREFFLENLKHWLQGCANITICDRETFIDKARAARL